MPQRPPKTYDEITRRTVPDPDSSWRPSEQQVRESFEGHRALDPEETALFQRVHDVLRAEQIDVIDVEVDHDSVVLRGQIPNSQVLAHITEVVSRIPGVGAVVDQLVIAPPT